MANIIPISVFLQELRAARDRKDGYIMGATGQDPKKWSESSWWYTQYTGEARRKALYWRENAKRVWDCQGLPEGIYKDATGKDINTKARYNYSGWCSPKGEGTIPAAYRVPGAAVFWGKTAANITHVAFLDRPVEADKPEGDWYLIEARGVLYGVVTTKLNARKPDFWGLMTKYYDYNGQGETVILSRGVYDSALVKKLQQDLIALGYTLGSYGADGDFGAATEKAVKAFQADNGLDQTGVYDEPTQKALEKRLSAPVIRPEESNAATVKPGTWNIRKGPGTGYATVEVVKGGDRLTPIDIGTWQPILKDGEIVYISQKALEETKA